MPSSLGHGRLLIEHFEIMKIFSRKVTPGDVKEASEVDLKDRCGKTKGRVKYVPPRGKENSKSRKTASAP